MSALFHLVEAATALSRLGETELSPSSAYRASYSSDMSSASQNISNSAYTPQLAATSVNDDACMLASSEMTSTTFAAKLRENHFQALCAAAASAGRSTTMTPVDATAALAALQAGLMNNPAPLIANSATPTTLLNTQQVLSELKSSIAAAMTSLPLNHVNVVASDASTASSRDFFPSRLHSVLADPTVRDIVTWLPHGKSFVVLRPDVFVNQVLPRYFAAEGSKRGVAGANETATSIEGVHKYPSFTRKLNRWGFRQISRAPDAGAFCHDLFQRDDPSLCRGMVCQKSRKLSSNSSRQSIGDDMMSVSSGSTMGTGNCSGSKSIVSVGNNITHDVTGKRLYSSTVTVSTAGNNSSSSNNNGVSNKNGNLPLKKRKSSHNVSSSSKMMNDIPSMISHGYQKMAKSSSGTLSMAESDLTSVNGSIGSDGINSNVNDKFAPCLLVPKDKTYSSNTVDFLAMKEALARHFQEQQYIFAMASLLENSRLAMEAAGIAQMVSSSNQQLQDHSIPISAPVFVATDVIEDRKPAAAVVTAAPTYAAPPPTESLSSSEAAKAELYKAFLEAMNWPLTPEAAVASFSS